MDETADTRTALEINFNDFLAELSRDLLAKREQSVASIIGESEIRRDIRAAITQVGFEEIGIPGVFQHAWQWQQQGKLQIRSTVNGLPPTGEAILKADLCKWKISKIEAEAFRNWVLAGSGSGQFAPPQATNQEVIALNAAPIFEADGSESSDWISKAKAIAQRKGEEMWSRGMREITARGIVDAVVEELANDSTTWGKQGARGSSNVRNEALKGWKFLPPSATNDSK